MNLEYESEPGPALGAWTGRLHTVNIYFAGSAVNKTFTVYTMKDSMPNIPEHFD